MLRRWRSRSLRFGRRPFKGIALAEATKSSTQIWSYSAVHGKVGAGDVVVGRGQNVGRTGSDVPRKAEIPGSVRWFGCGRMQPGSSGNGIVKVSGHTTHECGV